MDNLEQFATLIQTKIRNFHNKDIPVSDIKDGLLAMLPYIREMLLAVDKSGGSMERFLDETPDFYRPGRYERSTIELVLNNTTHQKKETIILGPYRTIMTDTINRLLAKDVFKEGDYVDNYKIALHLRRILKQPRGAKKLSDAFCIAPSIRISGGLFKRATKQELDHLFWENFTTVLQRMEDN